MYVEGNTKDGDAVVRNIPVLVGGVDGSGNVQTLNVSTAGTVSTAPGTPTALTASAPTAATVGVTSAQAVAVNTSRTGLVLVNTSAAWISLAFGAAAVLYSGITLAPNGGAYTMDASTFTTAQVRAIASAASSNMSVQEFV